MYYPRVHTLDVPYFEVAAFANDPFSGNPAGVCLLREWVADDVLQKIAANNNLSETAFVVAASGHYALRWFTPTVETDLCGHATLATAHVLFNHRSLKANAVSFNTKSGFLSVSRDGDRLVLDFPSQPPTPLPTAPRELIDALGFTPQLTFRDRDFLVVMATENAVRALNPDLSRLAQLDGGVIVTAPGDNCDFVSRYFAPTFGIPEDAVTGSNHCKLIPYWSKRLNKRTLYAKQVSARGGELFCENRGERVGIGGTAITYLIGQVYVASANVTQAAA